MKTPIITITASELGTFLDCPQKWKWGYKDLLVSRDAKPKLNLGTAVHDAIEFYYQNMDFEDISVYEQYALGRFNKELAEHAAKGGWPPLDHEVEDGKELAQSLIKQYVLYCRKNDDFKIVSLEEEFNLPIRNPDTGAEVPHMRLLGKIDGWADQRGNNFMLEHKTGAAFAGEFWWKYLNQIDVYIYAMQRKHGVHFKGAWFNGLYKKVPRKPKLLKNGSLSAAKSIVTTPEVYMASIFEHGLDPKDYEEVLQVIKDKGDRFTIREVVYRHPEDIKQIERTLWWAINTKESMTFFPKRKSDDCSWKCGFKQICIQDLPELREELYTVKKSKHSELTESTDDNPTD